MLPKYDLDKIKFATDRPTFEKAIDLYDKGKVTEFKEKTGSYSAIVLGTKPYWVSIEANDYSQGDCECYLGQNNILCKHIIAVAIRAVTNGKPLLDKDKQHISQPTCSGRLGELSKEELTVVKKEITQAMKYIKPYSGPSRIWFAYQDSLSEGCNRLSKIVSELPVSEQTARLLVDLLLRLEKKLSGGVDDSDGTVGGFMQETVQILIDYTKLDQQCIKAFEKLCGQETCFDWEEPLVKIVDEG